MNKVIRSMNDLENLLTEGIIPITETPPYFAESNDYSKISIVTGAADTFDSDLKKEPDNQWNTSPEETRKFTTKEEIREQVRLELEQLKTQFANSGFDNFYYMPANVPGMISWIFINNAMAAGFNSDGKPMIYFGKMKNLVRIPEPSLVEYYLTNHPAKPIEDFIIEHATKHTMEGKGDQLPMSLPIIKDEKQSKNRFYHMIINCSGRRTHSMALEEYAEVSGNFVIEIPLSDNETTGAYHGNVAILYYQNLDGDRGVIYVPVMLREDKRDFVYDMFKTFFGESNVHPILENDGRLYNEALSNLSMNCVSTGKGRMIASKNNPWTNNYLEHEIGLKILDVDMQGISLGGGGLQCCYTALNKLPLKMEKK